MASCDVSSRLRRMVRRNVWIAGGCCCRVPWIRFHAELCRMKRAKPSLQLVRHGPAQHGMNHRGAWMTADRSRPGLAMVSFDARNMPSPERSFPADCASAVLAHGDSPEMQFMQLSRRSNSVQRMVAVRYERGQFIQRVGELADFHKRLQDAAAASNHVPGRMRKIFAEAQGEPPAGGTLVLDADVDWMMWAGSTAAIVFLRVSSADRHSLSAGHANKVWLSADVEITLGRDALLDLLDSWRDVAREMTQ